jgi:hypothetical protein
LEARPPRLDCRRQRGGRLHIQPPRPSVRNYGRFTL